MDVDKVVWSGKESHIYRDASALNPDTRGALARVRPRQLSALWQERPDHWEDLLTKAIGKSSVSHRPTVFFRADDVGAGGRAFEALCKLFRGHQVPLAMAVVPAWLSDARKKHLFEAAPLEEPLWSWHQHGWRHVNWQKTGEKSEFGEHRPFEKQWRDIWQGRRKMKECFRTCMTDVFTPPWSRLSSATLRVLEQLGFKGVSMGTGFPRSTKSVSGLRNLRTLLDLHERESKDPASDFRSLLGEISSLLSKKEILGITIHHHRMNLFAFEFLDQLILLLDRQAQCRFVGFRDLLESNEHD